MPIVGPRPESGVRIDVERPLSRARPQGARAQTSTEGGPPWHYTGHAATPDASFALEATLGEDGSAEVRLPPEAPAGLDEKVRLLLRAAFKHAQGEEMAPPRRIVRWRPEG
jgi:hypothetical protein